MARADIFTWLLKWPSGLKSDYFVIPGYSYVLSIGVVQLQSKIAYLVEDTSSGIESPENGLDYPLVDSSPDVQNLLADLFLSYDDPGDYGGTSYTYPFKISWLYGLGAIWVTPPAWAPTPLNDRDILITDATGRTVFDSTQAGTTYHFEEWGIALGIVEWINGDNVCRLVYYRCLDENGNQLECLEDNHIVPESAIIDSRAIYRKPKHVKSLGIELNSITKLPITFSEGYNMEFDSTQYESGKDVTSVITLHARPGAGLGLWDNCDEDSDVIKSINDTAPTSSGDFFIGAQDCYWVRQAISNIGLNPLIVQPQIVDSTNGKHLVIGNDCGPCCNCDDYVNLALRNNAIGVEYARIAARVKVAQAKYEQVVDRWEKIVECLKSKPIVVTALAQTCPYVDIAVQLKNTSDNCWENVELTITIDPDDIEGLEGDSPEIVKGFSSLVTKVANNEKLLVKAYNTFPVVVKWPSIQPGGAITQKLRVKLPDCGCENAAAVAGGADCVPYAASFCATATIDGQALQVRNSEGNLVDALGCDAVTLMCPAEDGDAVNLGECAR